ncbi:DUF1905 domain-containing protein [Nocardioides sp. KR10-350]|uniref:DUF1905 domain-containing protein n=1 Tax=Nocardioides cheoyonin TaxID=3156615 RepID=UPI0032B43D44
MDLEFGGEIIEWRGPAPYLFVRVPDEETEDIAEIANLIAYGWGCIPVTARIGETGFQTSLFPKDGGYLVPVKVAVQRAEGVGEGDRVDVSITLPEPRL